MHLGGILLCNVFIFKVWLKNRAHLICVSVCQDKFHTLNGSLCVGIDLIRLDYSFMHERVAEKQAHFDSQA